MSKHTPGPWTIRNNFIDAEIDIVAEFNPIIDGSQANAHLIAAAPEMLEALEKISISIEFYGQSLHEKLEGFEELKTVIKKAKGQNE